MNIISRLSIFIYVLLFVSVSGCSKDESITPIDSTADGIPEIPGYNLVWNDEFNGTELDLTKWEHEVNANGGGNNELQYYTARPENSFIEDGKLVIRALQEEYTSTEGTRYYTSARLRTSNKGDWKYGRIDVSAKIPYGQGMWPAIWMLSTDWEYGGWPQSGEIDIMEHVGYDPGKIHGSVHTEAYYHKIGTQKTAQTVVPDANQNFPTYSLEWDENIIQVLVDNVVYFTFENDQQGDYRTWPFDKRFHLILNVAVGGDWPGNPTTNTIFPKDMVVDFVRVYQKK